MRPHIRFMSSAFSMFVQFFPLSVFRVGISWSFPSMIGNRVETAPVDRRAHRENGPYLKIPGEASLRV
jgi:hypothetical protein